MPSQPVEIRTRRRSRMSRLGAGAVALVATAVLVGACGGASPDPGVANVSSTTTSSTSTQTSDGGGSQGTEFGGSPSGGRGTSTFAIAGGSRANLLKFAACMRSHGVPNFPDPSANGTIDGNDLNPRSPSFQHAQQHCVKYMPNGGKPPSPAQQAQMQAKALAFSACMRRHGLPDFPDPQFSSNGSGSIGIRISANGNSDLNPQSPAFQNAQKACRSILPAPGTKP
jgi:hypothetical protein